MKKRFTTLSVLAVSALVFTACGGDDSSDTSATDAPSVDASADGTSEIIDISGVWARTSPAMTTRGAVYMTISASTDDELLSASVDASIAGSVEVHETVATGMSDDSMPMGDAPMSDMPMGDMSETSMPMDGMSGEMIMREVSSIMIPAGETVQLMPGGYHIMLLDLVAPLELGQTFEVTLTFANAGEVRVVAEVRDEAP